MSIPDELEYIVISFLPENTLQFVCKRWNNEIKSIRKNAVNLISRWWYSKRIGNVFNEKNMLRYYIVHYPRELFMTYPEFTVKKLGWDLELLDLIKPVESRKKSDVCTWMKNMPLSFDDWVSVGW